MVLLSYSPTTSERKKKNKFRLLIIAIGSILLWVGLWGFTDSLMSMISTQHHHRLIGYFVLFIVLGTIMYFTNTVHYLV